MLTSIPTRRRRLRRGSTARAVLMTLSAVMLIGLGLHFTGRFAASRPAEARIGSPAPDFELEEVGADRKIRLSALRGKPVIVNFFCGCGLCRAVAIKWSENKERVPDAHMLAVVGDHSAYNPVTVRDFKWGTGWEWPIVADISTKVTLSYESIDCPRAWVIDANGIIRHHNRDRLEEPQSIIDGVIAAVKALPR